MRNSRSKIIDNLIQNNQNSSVEKNTIKTTNINILLNRVKLEKRNKSKKNIILAISIISILFFTSKIVFGS
jgi:hypothetical protein